MKINIKIDNTVSNNKRAVYWNEELSHHTNEKEWKKALEDTRTNLWKTSEHEGKNLGSRLYHLLDGSGGVLTKSLKDSYHKGEDLYIYLDVPFEFEALPFEILRRDQFLLMNTQTHLIRKINDRNKLKDKTPEKRILKMLFMACSPINLKEEDILPFEKEEEQILKATERYPIDIRTEDSGSLNGIKDALYEANSFDIVHITGHAGIDAELGPVFYMEDDIGELDKVTPERLWEALKDFPPHLLFLSGCSTGKGDKLHASESFAHHMVDKGISIALGWGLPISDKGATKLTTELYKYLAIGKAVDFSVQRSRQVMEKDYHPWPLLRLFTDGSKLSPIIGPGQKLRATTIRKTTYKYLLDSQVKVLETGFVGRRREIQKGVKNLKGLSEKNGLLIQGTAGVGKSCLAGKLIERFPEKELVVIHGELRVADLVQRLRALFDKNRVSEGLDILKSTLDYDEKIKELFGTVFKHHPFLFYFDDFERNLKRLGDEYHVKSEYKNIIKPFLISLDWAEGQSNLIITSRYPFMMELEGKNLPAEKLDEIPLMSFRGPDLRKKKSELKYIPESKHTALYMDFGKGNPRLLEWLEIIASEEKKYNLLALKKVLKGKKEEFIRIYLAEIMAKTEGKDFHQFLHKASVYRLPLDKSAFESFGNLNLLEKGKGLTLFECETLPRKEPVYWVTPLIRENEFAKLSSKEQASMHKMAYTWYDKKIEESEKPDSKFLEEAVYHSLKTNNVRGACKHAIPLSHILDRLLLYQEEFLLFNRVEKKLTQKIIEDAKRKKDKNITILLNNLGTTLSDLGEAKRAIEYYEKALKIDLEIFGDKHPDVAIDYSNIGEALSALGEAKKAIEYHTKAQAIILEIFGEKHPHVAATYNNIGEAWRALGEAKKAIEYYTKAQAIILEVFGEKHPNVAITYSNIGLALSDLGEAKKAIEYYEKALEIDLEIFGDKHPSVARDYNNIGGALSDLGEAKKAIEYYTKAQAIILEVFGEKHPHVAATYNNIGGALSALSEAKRAIEYYEKALEIFNEVYGPDHPHTKLVKSNLEEIKKSPKK